MAIEVHRTVPWRRGAIRAAGRPRSDIYALRDTRAYAVTLDYVPQEDRLEVGYSIGQPLIPKPWLVASEDLLDGLWLDPQVPVGYLLTDVPVALKFLNPLNRDGDRAAAVVAVHRMLGLLREVDSLI